VAVISTRDVLTASDSSRSGASSSFSQGLGTDSDTLLDDALRSMQLKRAQSAQGGGAASAHDALLDSALEVLDSRGNVDSDLD
jgi:hypothetical protein